MHVKDQNFCGPLLLLMLLLQLNPENCGFGLWHYFEAKNSVFEFDHQKINMLKSIRCSKDDV